MSAERDALAFFETLYRGRPEPSVIALSFKRPGGGLHTRYALTAANAAEMVLGARSTAGTACRFSRIVLRADVAARLTRSPCRGWRSTWT